MAKYSKRSRGFVKKAIRSLRVAKLKSGPDAKIFKSQELATATELSQAPITPIKIEKVSKKELTTAVSITKKKTSTKVSAKKTKTVTTKANTKTTKKSTASKLKPLRPMKKVKKSVALEI